MTEKRVICAAILHEGRVLIARRAPQQKHAGMWEFPGGKVEAGESNAQCLARELQEEFGISGTVGAHVCDSVCEYPELALKITLCAYCFHWTGGTFQLRVHDQIAWADAAALRAAKLTAADVPIAQKLIEMLRA